jgi:hypothetical protein
VCVDGKVEEQKYILSLCLELLKVDALMMDAVSASETLVSFCQTTWYYIPDDSDLHIHCHENLKSI